MRTIESNRLIDEPMQVAADDMLLFGERAMPITKDKLIILTPEHTEEIEREVACGLAAFGALERTLAMRRLGLPTAVARIDCTIDPETGGIHSYEVEDRPAGMGILHEMGKKIADTDLGGDITGHLEEVFGRRPLVKRHADTLPNDDGGLFDVQMFTDTKLKIPTDQPILVRADPNVMATHPRLADATEQSIAPILEEGKRQYRIATGRADLVTSPLALPEDASFVLKGLRTTQCKEVGVRLTKTDATRLGNRDTITHTQARMMVEQEGAVIMEPFVPGISVEMANTLRGRGNMILRVFCLMDQAGAKAIGGMFVARPGHIVHGSHDAVSGLVLPDRGAS